MSNRRTEEAIVSPPELAALPVGELVTRAFGAIEGRLQTVSNRGSLHFTLYDTMNDRAVSCYLEADQDEILRDLWGERVTVEGSITRDANTGRPLTIRQIRRVRPIASRFGSFREAMGASPWYLSEVRPEEAIRKIRDGCGLSTS
jgi:hypothetical protein